MAATDMHAPGIPSKNLPFSHKEGVLLLVSCRDSSRNPALSEAALFLGSPCQERHMAGHSGLSGMNLLKNDLGSTTPQCSGHTSGPYQRLRVS